jgi:hypothetical protein
VKKKGSPSKACLPSPSSSQDFQPHWWEGGCIVEEEIPPRWKLTEGGENPITAEDTGTDDREEGSHYTYHLAAEHLELLFDIRQWQDEQVHGQRTIHQHWICCLRHSQMPQYKHAAPLASRSSSRSTPPMDIQVPQWLDAAHPRLWFLSITVFRMNSDYILTLFYSCVTFLVMAALNEACPRLVSGNKVPVEIFIFLLNFCKLNLSHDRHITAWSHLFWFPLCGGTGGCQTKHSCTLVI